MNTREKAILLIEALEERGWSQVQITFAVARRLGMKRNTVIKILKERKTFKIPPLPADVEELLKKGKPRKLASVAHAGSGVKPDLNPNSSPKSPPSLGAASTFQSKPLDERKHPTSKTTKGYLMRKPNPQR